MRNFNWFCIYKHSWYVFTAYRACDPTKRVFDMSFEKFSVRYSLRLDKVRFTYLTLEISTLQLKHCSYLHSYFKDCEKFYVPLDFSQKIMSKKTHLVNEIIHSNDFWKIETNPNVWKWSENRSLNCKSFFRPSLLFLNCEIISNNKLMMLDS